MSSALLAQIIAQEQAGFSAFLTLLNEEHTFLVHRQIEPLTVLFSKLEASASELAELARQREALTGQESNAGQFDMVAWINSNTGSEAPHLLGLWTTLIETAEKARVKHIAIGTLIETLAKNNTNAIQILITASKINNLYGPDGKLQGFSSTQLHGQA